MDKKREEERKIVMEMIDLYYKHHIDEYDDKFIEYVNARITHCPRMKEKTFCSKCPVHCYREDMRKQIKKVMKYSGPRMIFHHPLLVIKHVISSHI